MRKYMQVGTALLAAALLVGCDSSDSTPPAPSTAPPKPSAEQMTGATEKAAAGAAEAGANAMAAVESQAKDLYEKATSYIKEHKLDLAETAVTQLEALKPKLPAEWAPKIDSVKSALASAKKAAGALPGGLPGGK